MFQASLCLRGKLRFKTAPRPSTECSTLFLSGMIFPHSFSGKQANKKKNPIYSLDLSLMSLFCTFKLNQVSLCPSFTFQNVPFPSVTACIPVPKYSVVCILTWIVSTDVHPVRTEISWVWSTALSTGTQHSAPNMGAIIMYLLNE